jgi:hypothetical protein
MNSKLCFRRRGLPSTPPSHSRYGILSRKRFSRRLVDDIAATATGTLHSRSGGEAGRGRSGAPRSAAPWAAPAPASPYAAAHPLVRGLLPRSGVKNSFGQTLGRLEKLCNPAGRSAMSFLRVGRVPQ